MFPNLGMYTTHRGQVDGVVLEVLHFTSLVNTFVIIK